MGLVKKISQSLLLASLCTLALISKIHIDQDEKIETQLQDQLSVKKKKIVLFTCKGGYCHGAASEALSTLLSPTYDVTVINPIENVISGSRAFKKITGKYDAEELYNRLLKGKWINTLNVWAGYLAPIGLNLTFRDNKKAFEHYFEQTQPDLVISVISAINGPAFAAAKKLNIPYLLVTLDADLTLWSIAMDKKINYKKFALTIGFRSKEVQRQLKHWHIPPDQVHEIGFPIRQDFLVKKDTSALAEIYKIWGIPQQKFTTMMLMGGAGAGDTMEDFARRIAREHLDTHIIACIGRDEKTERKLKALQEEFSDLSITIVPFTTKIADLMAVSDVIITKSGPGSINEAMHMKLPMIVDYTSLPVFWEKPGIKLVERSNWGVVLKYAHQLPETLVKLMTNKQLYASIKTSLKATQPKVFNDEIQHIITTLLQQTNPNDRKSA